MTSLGTENLWRLRYLARRLLFLVPAIRRRRFRQRTAQVLGWLGDGDHGVRLSSGTWVVDFPNPDSRWPLLPTPIRIRYSASRGLYKCDIGDVRFMTRSMPLFEILNEARGYCLLGKPAPGDVCVDLGAGGGITNVYLSARVRGATLIALEPDPRAASQLQAELNDNGFAHAHVIRAAVSRQSGTALLDLRATGASRIGSPDKGGGAVQVPAMTLQEIVAAAGGRVDYLKADIEGTETEIAEPLRDLIRDGRVRVAAIASYHVVNGAPASEALERILSLAPEIHCKTVYARHPTTFIIRSDDTEMMGRLSAIPAIGP